MSMTSRPYHGPAGVMFTPVELIAIYTVLVGSERADHVAIREKISRFLAEARGD